MGLRQELDKLMMMQKICLLCINMP